MTQADKKVRKVTAFFLALSVCSNLVVEVHFFITEKLSVKPAILMENADCAITTITAHTHTHTHFPLLTVASVISVAAPTVL